MEYTSTKALPGYCVTSGFFLPILGVKDNISSVYSQGRQDEVHVGVKLLHAGKETEKHLYYHMKF